MEQQEWISWIVVLCLVNTATLKNSAECTKSCQMPFGLENGVIKDEQLSASSVYKNDSSTFGAKRARLNLRSWPPGYRANNDMAHSHTHPWISVELGRKLIVTGIATQGYGEPSVAEWITSYRVMYAADKLDYAYFVDLNGDVLNFTGNKDSNTIRRHEIVVPAIASSLVLLPSSWHNNIGLRMEVYGCEPGYYFEAWLMFDNSPFTIQYMNTSSDEYKEAALRATEEVQSYFNNVGGYLFNRILRLSPQPSPTIATFTTAEIAIYCIESSVPLLIAKLKTLIRKSALFEPEYLKIKYPLSCDCLPPEVNLSLKHSVSESDIVYTTNRSLNLRTDKVINNCSALNQIEYQWMFSRVDSDTGFFTPFLMYGFTDRTTIKLKPRLLGAGVLYVSLEASVSEVAGASAYDYGFLRVRHPDLVAKIVAPESILKGDSKVKLDSSGSYDPEFKWLQYRKLNFSWQCQRQCPWDSLDILTDSRAEREPCHGIANATDSVISNQRVLIIDVDFLRSSCIYLFHLSVAKGSRITHKEHALEVMPAVPFDIRCINNCAKKVSPQRLLTLQVFCGNQSCASLATFSWTIYILSTDNQGNSIWNELKNTTGLMRSSVNTTQLNLQRLDSLIPIKEGQKFQIKVKATDQNGREQEQIHYTFLINAPPILVQTEQLQDTGCKVWPREGSAIITDFHISCLGWFDKDTPLRYAFTYTFSSSTIIIQDGNVGNVTSKLPLGDPAKDYERMLELQIIDAFGEFSTVFVKTKVKPPPASEALLKLIKEAQSEMKLLVQGNDVDKAADMAITVLSVVDNNNQLKQDETFKDSVLNIMAGVEVNRLNLVTKIAVITAYSTNRVNHSLPQSSQEDALTLLRKSTMFLATTKNDTAEDLEVGNEINVNILTGIGNVMVASSKQLQSDINEVNVNASIDRHKSINITKSCVEIVDILKDEVVTPEGICENPIVSTSPYINLTACIEKANDMKVQKLLKGENGVKLPDPSALFPGMELDDNTVVDVKLVSFKQNPYIWHPKSRVITSSVLDVTLKNVTSGKAIHVEGLKKPVELFIKNWEREKEQEQKQKEKKKQQREYFVKPSPPNSIKNMRFHKIFLPYIDVETSIKIIPSNNEELEIYIRNKVRPTPAENVFKTIVPNFSACLNHTEDNGFFNCFSDPYLFTISPRITGHTGRHYLGIRYVHKPLESNKGTRVKRSCRDVSGRRQKRSCVEVKSPPIMGKLATSAFRNGSDVKYNLTVAMGACMYWSDEQMEWTNRGCKIGSESKVSKLHCLCNHLSAFGGDFFVAPNPIDFDKVFAEFGRLGETGNYVVLSFVCLTFGLYAVGLVFARRADKKDYFEVAPNVHLMTGGDSDSTCTYDISIQTGIWRSSGTTANVTIVLFGENGCTPPILLTHNHLEKKFFARGSVNTFTLHLSESLGSLFKIHIWHDNSGNNPPWFFHQVLVTCNETDDKWYFLGNRWLALEKGDGEIEAEIFSSGKKESLAFKNLFHFRGAKTLGEKHLWLSLFTKAPHSTFSRCQRLSCCLSILFAAMVTNAMFYKQGIAPEDTFKIGPIELSWTQIKIGLQSGLVAIPVNALVVAIFRNIKPSSSKETGNNKLEDDDAKPTGCFPHYCIYIGWTLCLMTSLVSAAFVVFYSLMWGKKVANQWLASVLISFFQDVIVIQPIKVVILVSLLSLIIKKPIENDEVYGQGHSNHKMDKKFTSYPPRDKELHKVRSVSVLKSRLVTVLMEIALFILFLSLLMVVCYGNRDSRRYQLTEAVRRVFTNFDKANSIESFWTWTRKHLLPGLYEVKWYNGRPFSYNEGFISNRESFMVGMPRLRQKRIQRGPNCQVGDIQPRFAQRFPRCIPYYGEENEDRTRYHMPKWIPIRNESQFKSLFERFYLCPRPWRYETAEELQTLCFQGLTSMYSGGGYIADLGYNTEDAEQVIDSLEINDWIDNMTAAIFVEFTLYEPATSLFSAVKLLFERFPNGGTNTITQFKTLTIYSPQDPHFRGFYETCHLLFMLLILFCVGTEVTKVYQYGCKYFKDPWSWLEIVLVASSLLSLAMLFLKESYTSEFVKKVKKNPFQSWSTDSIALWSDLEVTLLSFVVFLITMKLLRIIRFNPHIIQMRMTLRIAAKYFWSFSVVFMAIITAYVTLTTLTFGRNVYEYNSFLQSFSSILLMLIGSKAPFYELQTVSMIIGPFFVFAYMVSIIMLFLNMFLAILNDAYTESRKQGQEGLQDLALSNLLERKAKKAAKKTKVTTMKILQSLPRFLQQKPLQNAMTFENEVLVDPAVGEKEEDSAFIEDDNVSLRDIIALLSDIKYDISNSVMCLDDIVPMITIHDADKRWSRPNYASDDEDGRFYSSSSLFSSESDSAIAKLVYCQRNRRSLQSDALIVDEWKQRNFLVGETFL